MHTLQSSCTKRSSEGNSFVENVHKPRMQSATPSSGCNVNMVVSVASQCSYAGRSWRGAFVAHNTAGKWTTTSDKAFRFHCVVFFAKHAMCGHSDAFHVVGLYRQSSWALVMVCQWCRLSVCVLFASHVATPTI